MYKVGGRGWSLRKPRLGSPGLPKTPAPATRARFGNRTEKGCELKANLASSAPLSDDFIHSLQPENVLRHCRDRRRTEGMPQPVRSHWHPFQILVRPAEE